MSDKSISINDEAIKALQESGEIDKYKGYILLVSGKVVDSGTDEHALMRRSLDYLGQDVYIQPVKPPTYVRGPKGVRNLYEIIEDPEHVVAFAVVGKLNHDNSQEFRTLACNSVLDYDALVMHMGNVDSLSHLAIGFLSDVLGLASQYESSVHIVGATDAVRDTYRIMIDDSLERVICTLDEAFKQQPGLERIKDQIYQSIG